MMFDKTDMMLIDAKARWDRYVDRLIHEEAGASDIVAIMVVIVILLAVAAIFKEQLEELVKKVFEKAIDWVDKNG